jgi:hypothetical protein
MCEEVDESSCKNWKEQAEVLRRMEEATCGDKACEGCKDCSPENIEAAGKKVDVDGVGKVASINGGINIKVEESFAALRIMQTIADTQLGLVKALSRIGCTYVNISHCDFDMGKDNDTSGIQVSGYMEKEEV